MLKILIVDDEPHAREGLKLLLESLEMPVLLQTADDGEDGFEKACLLTPDILISDIRMPRLNGLDMLKRLRERNLRIPRVYLLTGYSEFAYAQQAIHYGVSEYILKPVATQALLQLVRRDVQALEQAPANISLDGRRLILVTEDETPAFRDFLRRQGYARLLAAAVYMGKEHHLPDRLKAELLRRKDLYVVTLADRHYRGILIGLRTESAEDALYSLHLLLSATPELTLCHTLRPPDTATDWRLLYDALVQAIPWSLTLGSNFFALEQTQPQAVAHATEDACYRAALHRDYAAQDYAACRDAIEQKLLTMIGQRCTPDEVRMVAATSLFKLNLQSAGDAGAAEARHVEATNRVSAAKTQRELFGAINDYFADTEGEENGQPYSRPVSLALRVVRQRYAEQLTLQSVAATLKITPQYLNRLFAKELGVTFSDYLTKFRLERACTMLKHQDSRVNQIALCVGYSDAKYFCTLFKRMMNLTPGQYRATNGKS